jgi:hypothetical protein
VVRAPMRRSITWPSFSLYRLAIRTFSILAAPRAKRLAISKLTPWRGRCKRKP